MYACIYVYMLFLNSYVCVYIMYIRSFYEGFTLVTCTRVYIDTQMYVVRALSPNM